MFVTLGSIFWRGRFCHGWSNIGLLFCCGCSRNPGSYYFIWSLSCDAGVSLIVQSERSSLAREIRDCLKRFQDVEPGKLSYTHTDTQALSLLLTWAANHQFNLEFEEDVHGITSRLTSGHFITLADLCNRRHQGSCSWIFEDTQYKEWLLGSFRTLYCVGARMYSPALIMVTRFDTNSPMNVI